MGGDGASGVAEAYIISSPNRYDLCEAGTATYVNMTATQNAW